MLKALNNWRRQDLSPESRDRLSELMDAQRDDPDDRLALDALLDAFMMTLTEVQLVTFARLLTEMTEEVH